jgi:hypothetical protein
VRIEALRHLVNALLRGARSRDHGDVSNACRAAVIAARASASPPSAQRPSGFPVAGLIDSETLLDPTHSPSIQCLAMSTPGTFEAASATDVWLDEVMRFPFLSGLQQTFGEHDLDYVGDGRLPCPVALELDGEGNPGDRLRAAWTTRSMPMV